MASIYHKKFKIKTERTMGFSTHSSNDGIIFQNSSYFTDPFGVNVISTLDIYLIVTQGS